MATADRGGPQQVKVRIGGALHAEVQKAPHGVTCSHPRCTVPAAFEVVYLGTDDTHEVAMCSLHMPIGLKPPAMAAKETT